MKVNSPTLSNVWSVKIVLLQASASPLLPSGLVISWQAFEMASIVYNQRQLLKYVIQLATIEILPPQYSVTDHGVKPVLI